MGHYNTLSKRIQLIWTSPKTSNQVVCTHTNSTVSLSPRYKAKIDSNWQENHKGWVSSPLAQLVEIVEKEDIVEIKTAVTEYSDHVGSDFLSKQEGDTKILDMIQALGNSVLMMTRDNYIVFGKRGSNMTIAPDEYDGGGSLMAAVYALENGMEKLRGRLHLPPNERYKERELLFPFYNPLEHVIPAIVRERGINKEYINEDSLMLLGFCRGYTGGRNPNALPYIELNLNRQEYLAFQKEKINWLEKTTGKKQDKKIAEAEQEVFIHEGNLEDFLLNKCETDDLGKKLVPHPISGRYEVVDVAIAGCILYLLSRQPERGLNLVHKIGENDVSLAFLSEENHNGNYASYKFSWAK